MIQQNVLLAPHTSWLVGGTADFFSQPQSVEELREALLWAQSQKMAWTVLGGGTNSLVSDRGIRGLTIVLSKLVGSRVQIEDKKIVIEAFSGTSKSELLKIFLKHKLEPALFLAGLPGDVGGGLVMNAGVSELIKPREFVEITDWLEVMRPNGDIDRLSAHSLNWSYRHLHGWQPGIIVRAGLSWPLDPQIDILEKVRDANRNRLSKQPLDLPSCGSVFRNPQGTSAGRLIESLGLKGYTVGGAKVSEKHANFIVNFQNASATDIHQVISHVQAESLVRAGISLQTEVAYLGDWES